MIPLSSDTWGAEERLAIQAVVDSGQFYTGGPSAGRGGKADRQ